MVEHPNEAQSFYITAKGFAEAIKLVHTHPHGQANSGLIFLPVQTLQGFALELYLKAWLAGSGYDKARLRNEFGHDLKKLLQHAYDEALPEVPNLTATIEQSAEGHGKFTYRYPDFKNNFKAMGMMTVFQVLDDLDREVDTKVGASASRGLQPGH